MKKRINTNSAARAVIYARYSSANQRDCSIEQQVEKCRELAAREVKYMLTAPSAAKRTAARISSG